MPAQRSAGFRMGSAASPRRASPRRASPRRGGPRGFTLIELLVTLAILIVLIFGVLALFEAGSKITRVQSNLADLQQGIRIAQYDLVRAIRMAGRGQLAQGPMPNGVAVAVRNDVPAVGDERFIAVANAASPPIVAGTDVVTVRGVFETLYQVEPTPGTLILDDPDAPTAGSIGIQNPHPTTGVPQNLQPLIDAINAHDGEAFLLISPLDLYATVHIDRGASSLGNPNDIRVAFDITPSDVADPDELSSGGSFSTELRSVTYAGILEEYRYYIREGRAIAGDAGSELRPSLSRARMQPGTELAHPANPNLADDIADNVFDLQAAIGLNRNPLVDQVITENIAGDDEWLFNSPDDDPEDFEKWNGDPLDPAKPAPLLYYLRVTTLAHTDRRDLNYQAPLLTVVEDKDYGAAPHTFFNEYAQRQFRRRALETVIDLRNL